MGGLDPSNFINTVKNKFRQECDFEGWLNEHVYFKTFKILIKAKNEMFQGVNRLRFQALDVVNIT